MFTRILVAYDGSEESKSALEAGIDLATKLYAELFSITAEKGIVVPVTIPGFGPTESEEPTLAGVRVEAGLLHVANEAEEIARQQGFALHASTASGENEVDTILEAVSANNCDLLILGPRQHSWIKERLLPHTATEVGATAPCSVLIVR